MEALYHSADKLGNLLREKALTIATAESCTGGGLASMITEIPGSSLWFGYGWVTYSNHAKQKLLDVSSALLETEGAVSEAVACAMAKRALLLSGSHFSISITGIAGPTGGTKEKPVGTIWLCWAKKDHTKTVCLSLLGDRQKIREQTLHYALDKSYDFATHYF